MYLKTSVGVNDGRQAAHRHATNGVTACRVGDTLTHGAHDRGALEANWPHCARWIQIKHVEDIAKVEACCLHAEGRASGRQDGRDIDF